jgi:hypothetical protein
LATLIGSELTDELLRHLDGSDIASKTDKAIVICTIGEDGWPHPAMLSYFEVVAKSRRSLHIAAYRTSRTTANMRERGKATLVLVDQRLTCYLKGSVTEIAASMRSASYNARLQMQVEQVFVDEPHQALEPDAFVSSGITYTRKAAQALAQAHAVFAELAESGIGDQGSGVIPSSG